MPAMKEYTFGFKMVNKTKNSGSERVAGLTPPLKFAHHCVMLQNGEIKNHYKKSHQRKTIRNEFALFCKIEKVSLTNSMCIIPVCMK